jgi:hypothetical protein
VNGPAVVPGEDQAEIDVVAIEELALGLSQRVEGAEGGDGRRVQSDQPSALSLLPSLASARPSTTTRVSCADKSPASRSSADQ